VTTKRLSQRGAHGLATGAPRTSATTSLKDLEQSLGFFQQTVLIVDDEPDIRTSLRDLLQTSLRGLRTLTCEDGKAAAEALKRQPVDLIIADYRMPEMDGLEFLKLARKAAPEVPRILVTAYPDLDLAIRALNEAAIENFFTKPLEPDKILDVSRGLLHERRIAEIRNRAFIRSLDLLSRRLERPADSLL